eukprot:333167-Rhodomonas_salina.1
MCIRDSSRSLALLLLLPCPLLLAPLPPRPRAVKMALCCHDGHARVFDFAQESLVDFAQVLQASALAVILARTLGTRYYRVGLQYQEFLGVLQTSAVSHRSEALRSCIGLHESGKGAVFDGRRGCEQGEDDVIVVWSMEDKCALARCLGTLLRRAWY